MEDFNSGAPSGDDRLWGCLAYAGSIVLCCGLPVAALIIYLMKKEESPYIRFHAGQALVLGLALLVVSIILSVLSAVMSMIPGVGTLWGLIAMALYPLLSVAMLGYWVYLAIMAYRGEEIEVPTLADFVREKL